MSRGWLLLPESAVPPGDEWLSPAEIGIQEGLRFSRRRRAWRLGRFTAKSALCAAGRADGPWDALSILADPDGAPHVFRDGEPAPFSVSISHRAGTSLCVVADRGAVFGCDLERVEPRSERFVADYFTAREREAWREAPPDLRPLLANLVWSAKESAVKALGTGWRIDTRSVEVDAALVGGEGWHLLRVAVLGRVLPLRGWWRREGSFVLTLVAEPMGPPPERLAAGRRVASGPIAAGGGEEGELLRLEDHEASPLAVDQT